MFYDNSACDGCGLTLHDGDDVVVCPVCGTPQHRECYELNNRCVNEHLHESGFVWQNPNASDEPETPEIKENKEEYEESLGNSQPVPMGIPMPALDVNPIFFENAGFSPDSEFDGITAKEAVSYVQVSAKRYVRKFMRTNGKTRFVSWNWGAFFLAPAWFFYRKLYKIGAIFLAFMVASTLVFYPIIEKVAESYDMFAETREEIISLTKEETENPSEENKAALEQKQAEAEKKINEYFPQMSMAFLIQYLIPNVLAALIADSFYKKKMLDDIKKAKTISSEPQIVKACILRAGGVALIPAVAALMAENYLPTMILKIVNYFILK